MWRDHPVLGVGVGNYPIAYARYSLPKWRMALGHAHNYYLNIAAETGLLGLLAYCMLWATATWQTVQAVKCLETRIREPLRWGHWAFSCT